MRYLLPIALLAACTDDAVAPPTPTPVAAPARPAPPAPPLLGVVAARDSEVVSAQIDGRIIDVIAKSGAHVHPGDPIVEIDPTLLDEKVQAAAAAVEVARAELAGAGAEVAEARRQVALERRMFEAGAAAEESVRVAKASLARAVAADARATASLHEAEAARAALDSQLQHTHVTARIEGTVSLVKAQKGEVVAPGMPIARVFDPSHLMIRFQVTHDRRHDVLPGTTVELHVPGLAALAAHVTSVSADLEPPLDFAVAEADITDAAPDLQIGVLGEVRIAP